MAQNIQISSFYHFAPLADQQVNQLKCELESWAQDHNLKGLFIIGTEGANSTFSGPFDEVAQLKKQLFTWLNCEDLFFKDSFHDKHPFNDFKVKVRDEIVTIGRKDLIPQRSHRHLSPQQWHQALQDKDSLVLDTRNDYEYKVGHFANATNPDIKEFTEFPQYLKDRDIPKDKKILIYCTGGIRCEKAILDMEEQGYENVYQLEGGILNYLAEFPEGEWQGECFVFDFRVAVDNHLQPSKQYRLCPHCGDPGKTKIECLHCGTPEVVCETCIEKDPSLESCSKNCAHHHRLGHRFKKIHKESRNRRHPF